jgi:hypothetical protein
LCVGLATLCDVSRCAESKSHRQSDYGNSKTFRIHSHYLSSPINKFKTPTLMKKQSVDGIFRTANFWRKWDLSKLENGYVSVNKLMG